MFCLTQQLLGFHMSFVLSQESGWFHTGGSRCFACQIRLSLVSEPPLPAGRERKDRGLVALQMVWSGSADPTGGQHRLLQPAAPAGCQLSPSFHPTFYRARFLPFIFSAW